MSGSIPSMTSLGLLGSGGGIIEPTKEAATAVSNYMSRVWKISNHWRQPPQVVEHRKGTLKILVVLSDTGGGHKASASSITSAIEFLEPDVEVKTVDVLENYTLGFSNRLYNVSFKPMSNSSLCAIRSLFTSLHTLALCRQKSPLSPVWSWPRPASPRQTVPQRCVLGYSSCRRALRAAIAFAYCAGQRVARYRPRFQPTTSG